MTAWKEALRTITGSWARFVSIAALMLLGAFALVGLKVTGPDMRATAADYFEDTQLADVMVTSPVGISPEEEDALNAIDGATTEFGYLTDAQIGDTTQTLRVMSLPDKLSTFKLISGDLPTGQKEIALTADMEDSYSIGDEITINEESRQLGAQRFTVTGFVRSPEFLDSSDLGQTQMGTGQLSGYAAVAPEAFDSPAHTVARIGEMTGPAPYSDALLSGLDAHTETVEDALASTEEDRQPGMPAPTVTDRRDFSGYLSFGDNSDRIDAVSEVFPVFLFAIAALVSLTTMTRMVQEQRTTNGTFAALGYSPHIIRRKYLLYGISASTIGSLLGVAIGHTLLPTVIFSAYQKVFTFDHLELSFYPLVSAIAVGIAILCTVLVASVVATRELREAPSRFLLPKPPAAGTRIFLERITPLWKRMSFTQKVTARNLFRYKRRMFMTIFGIAGCTGLLILAFGIRDSVTGISEKQFDEVLHYDVIAVENPLEATGDIGSVAGVAAASPVHFEQLTTRVPGDSVDQDISYIAPTDSDGLDGFVTLRSRQSQEPVGLPDNGVVVSEKLAHLLDLDSGDSLTLEDSEGESHRMTVRGVTEMYAGHYIFASSAADSKIFDDDGEAPNAHLIQLDHQASINAVSADLMQTDGVEGVVQIVSLIATIDSVLDGLDMVILVLIVCALLLAVVVIFNLTNINVSERIRELSTIKVLGFYSREVTMYIFRETLILTVLGIAAGFALGVPLHAFVINSVPPDILMFQPDLLWTNFVISAAMTFAISLVIMGIMHVRLKNIDMLDALKAQD